MIVFIDGWDSETNNNTVKKLDKDALQAAITAAAGEVKTRTTDEDFLYFSTAVETTSSLLKAKVVKGMHQESGNDIIPESHTTVEVPEFPRVKRYHLWFMWLKKGWTAAKLTYEYETKKYRSLDILK